MIIFYNKKTLEVVGTIEGRVHFDHHMKAYVGDLSENGRLVIGYEDTGEEEEYIDTQGKVSKRPLLKEHNLHLWQHQLNFENPHYPKRPHHYKIELDASGNVTGLTEKPQTHPPSRQTV